MHAEDKLQKLVASHKQEISTAMEREREAAGKERESILQKASHEAAAAQASFDKRLAEKDENCASLSQQILELRESVFALESAMSCAGGEKDELKACVRSAEQSRMRMQAACEQVSRVFMLWILGCVCAGGFCAHTLSSGSAGRCPVEASSSGTAAIASSV